MFRRYQVYTGEDLLLKGSVEVNYTKRIFLFNSYRSLEVKVTDDQSELNFIFGVRSVGSFHVRKLKGNLFSPQKQRLHHSGESEERAVLIYTSTPEVTVCSGDGLSRVMGTIFLIRLLKSFFFLFLIYCSEHHRVFHLCSIVDEVEIN